MYVCSQCSFSNKDKALVSTHLKSKHKSSPRCKVKLQEMKLWIENIRLCDAQVKAAKHTLYNNIYGTISYVKDIEKFDFFNYVSDDMSDHISDINSSPPIENTSTSGPDSINPTHNKEDLVTNLNSLVTGKRKRKKTKEMEGFVSWDKISTKNGTIRESALGSRQERKDPDDKGYSESGSVPKNSDQESSPEEKTSKVRRSAREMSTTTSSVKGQLHKNNVEREDDAETSPKSLRSSCPIRSTDITPPSNHELFNLSKTGKCTTPILVKRTGFTTRKPAARCRNKGLVEKSFISQPSKSSSSETESCLEESSAIPLSRPSSPPASRSKSPKHMFECLKCGTKIIQKKELVLNHVKRHKLTLSEYVANFLEDRTSENCKEVLDWEKEVSVESRIKIAFPDYRGKFKCCDCAKYFDSKETLRSHMYECTGKLESNALSTPVKKPSFKILFSTIGNYFGNNQSQTGKQNLDLRKGGGVKQW